MCVGSHQQHTAAAVGDNGAWQSCALQVNAICIRKSLSDLGHPKADPQAGEGEEDLQCGCSFGVGRVCEADQGQEPLWDERWQAVALLLHVQIS